MRTENFKNKKNQTCPKIIHFIWIDFDNELNENPLIPENYIENVEICRKLNPEFDIKVWKGKACLELLEKDYPWFIDTYKSFSKPIMRCDAIRYFILHKYGGVYSDIDNLFQKNISPLLNLADFLVRREEFAILSNDFMIGKKNSDFLEFCIHNISEKYNGKVVGYDILATAGPLFLLMQMHKYNGKETLRIEDKLIYDSPIKNVERMKECYVVPMMHATWMSTSERKMYKLCANILHYKILLILGAITVFVYCVYYFLFQQ